MIIIDRYSKMTIYFSIKFIMKTNEMCNFFCDEMFFKFELFKNIVFDKKILFISNFWSTFVFHARFKRKFNTIFYFQIDEQIEKQNQILKHYLRCFCNHKQNDWTSLLIFAIFVYNCVKHATTNLTFFEVILKYILSKTWLRTMN